MCLFRNLIRILVVLALCSTTSACFSSVASQDIALSKRSSGTVISGFYNGSFKHNGHERTFLVYIPPGYDGQTPMPLIVGLHGGLGTGEIFEEQTHLSKAANAHGYIVVYPDGIGRAWNAGTCCGEPAERNIDDVGFITELVKRLNSRYNIDMQRVYVTGFSNGAMMAHKLVCKRPDLFDGFAAVSGGPMTDSCQHVGQPTPALLVQGTDDPRIPWNGGVVNGSFRMAFKKVVQMLGERNACSNDKRKIYARGSGAEGTTICWALSNCAAPVHYCVVHGGGHQWPGGKTYLSFFLGDNTKYYNATAQVVQFFDKLGQQD